MEDFCEYDNLTDEELLSRLRGGETQIMEYILDKYKPLVRKHANAMYLIGGETEDLIQEGMIGLFKAIRDYDDSRESGFGTFARVCITRQLYTAVEASNRKKHAPLNSYISLYSPIGEDGVTLSETIVSDGADNPEQLIIARENGKAFWEALKKKLSPLENQVLDEYLSGLNYQQIAEKLGKSPKTVDNALSRIKCKISTNKSIY
jgi:RNA polymerase sporulation-specific sigma factor